MNDFSMMPRRLIFVAAAVLFAYPLMAEHLSLVEALKAGDWYTSKALLAGKPDVNASLADGSTPLHWAAYQGWTDIVELLLKAGAKASVADEYGETPLMLACVNGDAKIVEGLLAAGADVNAARRFNGETALMVASRNGKPEVVKLLIEHGAKVEAVESIKGQNALMWAAEAGKAEVVEVLLKAGAKPDAASKAGFTPLIFASARGSRASAALLLAAGADINRPNAAGMNPLLAAVSSGRREVVDLLLEKDANLGFRDPGGNNALHIASERGNLALVKLFLSRGLDVNARTGTPVYSAPDAASQNITRPPGARQTPLLLAAKGGYTAVMRTLVEAGADTTVEASDHTTVLLAAASSAKLEPVKYAYSLDQRIKAQTDYHRTVLHLALQGFSPSSAPVVEFLAEKGAELDTPDDGGDTPWDIAHLCSAREDSTKVLAKLFAAAGRQPRKHDTRANEVRDISR